MSLTSVLLTVLGIAVFVVGLLFSIAWHELGHLSTAKMFGIRVPQYMVGFGPTIWSKKKGDTEYGIKAIPAAWLHPHDRDVPARTRRPPRSPLHLPWRGMIEDARSAAFEELEPGDEKRLFYTRKPWKRVIVMFAGPFMNLILAVAIFMGVAMTFGFQTQTTEVGGVQQCVIAQSEKRQTCKAGDDPSPAKAAGLQEGDKIVAFAGTKVDDWATLSDRIRETIGPATIVVERDGKEVTLNAVLRENVVAEKDSKGEVIPEKFVEAGYLGFAAQTEIVPLGFGDSVVRMGDMIENGVDSIIALPSKIPALWDAAFSDGERADDSPVGVVGAARIGGEVMNLDIPAQNQVAMMLFLLAGFNLSLFLFNMLPLLPLDGGHIAGALWESLRRNLAKVFRRPDPGPFDVARLMPVAYVVAGLFICFTLLVLVADIVNPVKIT